MSVFSAAQTTRVHGGHRSHGGSWAHTTSGPNSPCRDRARITRTREHGHYLTGGERRSRLSLHRPLGPGSSSDSTLPRACTAGDVGAATVGHSHAKITKGGFVSHRRCTAAQRQPPPLGIGPIRFFPK